MKETKDGTRTRRISESPSTDTNPLVLDIEDFKVRPQTIVCVQLPLIEKFIGVVINC